MSDIFWQAPGNGKGFDSFLGDNSKMNNRTIGVMSYIKENSNIDGFVNENKFKKDIKDYLLKNFNENKNDSLDTHFYKPALFYGFINRDKNHNLSLSIEGNLFLKTYLNNNFTKSKELIINQLDDTKYPNIATKKIKELHLFPFRILFKLLLDNKELSVEFIEKSLVNIIRYSDIETYEKTKDINDIKKYEYKSSKYKKFNTWIVNSLVNLEILNLNNRVLTIDKSIYNHLKMLYENINYHDMFFYNLEYDINDKISKKRIKRDPKLILEAKERDKFICQVNKEHITFKSKGKNYVEGHHIIPMYQQKNYDFILDNVDNILSLCPTCHREIHYSDNKKDILDKVYNINNLYFKEKDIEKIELYKMYNYE